MNNTFKCDYLVIGAGIIGLAIAKELKNRKPDAKIVIIEKEPKEALHSSGRNSGVLHAGFYYTANSLKAQFTREGNRRLTEYCLQNNLKINRCKKVVVASDESEIAGIDTLYSRGKANGVDVTIIDEKELREIEPNAKTVQKALFSPTTSTIDPSEISSFIKQELESLGVEFRFSEGFRNKLNGNSVVSTAGNIYECGKIINTAGLYADKIAKQFGFSEKYTIIPFKGIYLKYTGSDQPIKTNIYPVPNLKNPFLGVHYTVTVDNTVKIGPTAIPAFWRENYEGISNFRMSELMNILFYEAKLFFSNAFGFRSLAFEEMRKYNKEYFVGLALKMINEINKAGFNQWSRPGIRAQLLNVDNLELCQDFVVEGDQNSTHVLNAVSPAFTSSFPFAEWVIDNYILGVKNENNKNQNP